MRTFLPGRDAVYNYCLAILLLSSLRVRIRIRNAKSFLLSAKFNGYRISTTQQSWMTISSFADAVSVKKKLA